jgi:hypothetical protein
MGILYVVPHLVFGLLTARAPTAATVILDTDTDKPFREQIGESPKAMMIAASRGKKRRCSHEGCAIKPLRAEFVGGMARR